MKRGSMQCKIPEDMREELAADPWMRRCIVGQDCEGRIEWNHGLSYAGRRVSELYALIPMCARHHQKEAQFRQVIKDAIRYRIYHFNAANDFKEKYPKSTLL